MKESLCGRDLIDGAITRSSVSRDGILRETLSVFFRHSGDHALLITSETALAEPRVEFRCRYHARRPRSDLCR